MPDRLLLRLRPDGGLTWLREGRARDPIAIGSDAPPRSIVEAAGEIVVLVPAQSVLLTETQLGTRNQAQLRQAVPFAVEDQLLQPVDELHFALSRRAGDTIGVAVVARGVMRGWLERLAEAGIRPDAMLPESLALPVHAERACVCIEDAQATVRLTAWRAFACSPDELPAWLAQIAAAETIAPLVVHDFRAAPPIDLPVAVEAYHERQRNVLAWLADGASVIPLNLLEGGFAQRHRHARGKRWWSIAAALAAGIAMLAFANLVVDVVRLSRTSSRMETLADDAVRKAFPDVDPAQLQRIGPQALMRSRVASLHGNADTSGLLGVLARIGPVLGNMGAIQTHGMEYRNGTLELALRAPDVGALDLVRERLATIAGISAEVTAANPGPDGVDGRIRIKDDGHAGSAP